MISGGDKADFARPVNWVDCLPHEGDFSYDGDLSLVTSIFEQALAYKLLWPLVLHVFFGRRMAVLERVGEVHGSGCFAGTTEKDDET